MSADLSFPISIQQLHLLSPQCLLENVKGWIRKQSPSCVIHPHGFWIVLLSISREEEWRFHYWPTGPSTITGMPAMIHTHDRVVDSRIILGELKHIEHRLRSMQSGGRPIYEVVYYGDKYLQKT